MSAPAPKKPRGSAAQMAKVHACEARCDRLDRDRKVALADAFKARADRDAAQSELRHLQEVKAKETVQVRVSAQVFPPETHADAEAHRARIAALGIICGVEFV
jgi:hypothetical protein